MADLEKKVEALLDGIVGKRREKNDYRETICVLQIGDVKQEQKSKYLEKRYKGIKCRSRYLSLNIDRQ